MTDDSQTADSPYAGRWVARVRGKIIAQGSTPEQALHAAQTSRHKEKPEILFMPVPFSYSPLIEKIRDILPDQEIYLVGGAVRDMLFDRPSHDLDFALPMNGIALARRVALRAGRLALVEHHRRVAVEAHRGHHAEGLLQCRGHRVGHRHHAAAHRGLAHVGRRALWPP